MAYDKKRVIVCFDNNFKMTTLIQYIVAMWLTFGTHIYCHVT